MQALVASYQAGRERNRAVPADKPRLLGDVRARICPISQPESLARCSQDAVGARKLGLGRDQLSGERLGQDRLR